jgi:hypothetical protein
VIDRLVALLRSKDFRSTLIAAGGLGLGVLAAEMAKGYVGDWRALFVAAGGVAVNAVLQRVKPFLPALPPGDDD